MAMRAAARRVDGAIVATAGALTHYNAPYADLYMEVEPHARRRGFGAPPCRA
jgi:hypothetical protein